MTYDDAFAMGQTFDEFLDAAQHNRALWSALARRRAPVQAAATRVAAVGGRWRLLVLADDWCGDAVNTLPVMAAVATAAGLPLRVVPRDAYPEVRDRHLTGGSRSIPIAVLLDETGRPHGWWGPRPRPLQEWFLREGRTLSKPDRYREMRRWYARDRGVTTANEMAELVACAARRAVPPYEGTRPCPGRRAA